ncbi:MAG: hypothetical protein IPJ19_03590 [Planctomycetes bacterium]|nr:hypothetical protein [Planctomycetota bacterium]
MPPTVQHTLFLVHGVGLHPADTWAQPVIQKLEEVAARYPSFQETPLSQFVRYVPINYDLFFEGAITRWANEGGAFAEFAARNELIDAADLSWIGALQGEDLKFFRECFVDVILYRFFKLEQNRIQDNVKRDFAKAISAQLERSSESVFSVLAHSLGCAVAHDSLHELAQSTLGGTPNALSARNFGFKSIHMLANTSRLLQTRVKAYESSVHPGPKDGVKNYCQRYYDYRHECDPIVLVRRFEPTWSEDYFTQRVVRHYRSWDIHAFRHYLDNPRVHVPILTQLAGSSAITRGEYTQAVAAYDQFGGDFAFVPSIRGKIGQLAALQAQLHEDSKLEGMFQASLQMFAILRSIYAELKAIHPDMEKEF